MISHLSSLFEIRKSFGNNFVYYHWVDITVAPGRLLVTSEREAHVWIEMIVDEDERERRALRRRAEATKELMFSVFRMKCAKE